MTATDNPLDGVEAFVFDVFGTVVNYRATVSREVGQKAPPGALSEQDAIAFADEWRQGYYKHTRTVASGAEGSSNVDQVHRQILDNMLTSERWKHLAAAWDEEERKALNMVWHRLDAWPDSSEGLYELKKHAIIGTLSNGNVRLLVDMAKYAKLPWDVVLSGEIIGTYKPNPAVYNGAAKYLNVPTEKLCMVAAHIGDLRAAARCGLKTVYVPRSTEDAADVAAAVKSKAEGGEVDVVVPGFLELAKLAAARKN